MWEGNKEFREWGKVKKGLFHCVVFVKIIDSPKRLRNHQTKGSDG